MAPVVFRAPDLLETLSGAQTRSDRRHVLCTKAPLRCAVQKRICLSDAPLLAALSESLRATLAGDLPGLRRHYDVSWSAPAPAQKGWQLTLTPRERVLRDAVAKVVLRGTGSDVSTIEIVEASGDLTLMQIVPLAAVFRPGKK